MCKTKTADQLRREGYIVECPECGGEMLPYEDVFVGDPSEIWWCCVNVNCELEINNRDVVG